MKHWWEGEEWARAKPMEFGKPQIPTGRNSRRVALTTTPTMVKGKYGVEHLRLENRPQHLAVTIFVGSVTAAW